jgi:hypothetical protein
MCTAAKSALSLWLAAGFCSTARSFNLAPPHNSTEQRSAGGRGKSDGMKEGKKEGKMMVD